MIYINTKTLKYPVYQGEIRLAYPNRSFSSTRFEPPEEYAVVVREPRPVVDYTKTVHEEFPVFENGIWVQKWRIEDTSPDQIEHIQKLQGDSVRLERDRLLAQSDWTQLNDVVMSDEKKQQWLKYRQDLRDITAQERFPWQIKWPVKP